MDVASVKHVISRCFLIGSFFILSGFLFAKDVKKISDINPSGLPGSPDLPKAIPFNEDIRRPGLAPFEGRKSKDAMEKAAGYLTYLIRRGYKNNRSYYQVKLGQFLADLNHDASAFRVLQDFLNQDDPSYNTRIIEAPESVEALRKLALLTQMRIAARNDQRELLEKSLALIEPNTGYEHLLLAEIHMLYGHIDQARIQLESACANPNDHPESNRGYAYIPMRAMTIAYQTGDPELARDLGDSVHRRGRDAEKWPRWKSAWRIIDELFALSAQPLPDLSLLRDGIYQSVCAGFIDSIFVEISVRANHLDQVRVVKGIEDRPYSAMEVIPERIQSRQTFAVDGVTGATVTSCAVMISAIKAILKAQIEK